MRQKLWDTSPGAPREETEPVISILESPGQVLTTL